MLSFEYFFSSILQVLISATVITLIYSLPTLIAALTYAGRRKMSNGGIAIAAVAWVVFTTTSLFAAWPLAIALDVSEVVAVLFGLLFSGMSIALSVAFAVAFIRYLRSFERWQDKVLGRHHWRNYR